MTDDVRRRRIAAHARGEWCDACGTRQPHGDDTEPTMKGPPVRPQDLLAAGRMNRDTDGDYAAFITTKTDTATTDGPDVDAGQVHNLLHPWQRDLVVWAARTRRAALWADTGLGKTFMMIEWARLSGATSLIVAPLAVCAQTVREAAKLGVTATFVRDGSGIAGPGMWVTNYERVASIDTNQIDAVALDESSILKQSTGKTRTMLIEHFAGVPARLACSATPAPNDPEELTNQAEFLGRMARNHMLAAYFVHDQINAGGYRLKGHALRPMIDWMTTWAVAIRRPSDIGGSDDGYDLPGLDVIPHYVDAHIEADGQLFATDLGGVSGRAQVRRQTLDARVAEAARLVNAESGDPWVLWVGMNDEADAIAAAIPGAVNVHGSLDADEKARLLLGFADGDYRVLITKPSIASMGMNWQHCARMAFVGLGDSYEQYYQAIRRCYRYGQSRVVHAHIVLSELESQIADNVARKERQASVITTALIDHARKGRAA